MKIACALRAEFDCVLEIWVGPAWLKKKNPQNSCLLVTAWGTIRKWTGTYARCHLHCGTLHQQKWATRPKPGSTSFLWLNGFWVQHWWLCINGSSSWDIPHDRNADRYLKLMENPSLFLNTVSMLWWRNRVWNYINLVWGGPSRNQNCPSASWIIHVLAELQHSSCVNSFNPAVGFISVAEGRWCRKCF